MFNLVPLFFLGALVSLTAFAAPDLQRVQSDLTRLNEVFGTRYSSDNLQNLYSNSSEDGTKKVSYVTIRQDKITRFLSPVEFIGAVLSKDMIEMTSRSFLNTLLELSPDQAKLDKRRFFNQLIASVDLADRHHLLFELIQEEVSQKARIEDRILSHNILRALAYHYLVNDDGFSLRILFDEEEMDTPHRTFRFRQVLPYQPLLAEEMNAQKVWHEIIQELSEEWKLALVLADEFDRSEKLETIETGLVNLLELSLETETHLSDADFYQFLATYVQDASAMSLLQPKLESQVQARRQLLTLNSACTAILGSQGRTSSLKKGVTADEPNSCSKKKKRITINPQVLVKHFNKTEPIVPPANIPNERRRSTKRSWSEFATSDEKLAPFMRLVQVCGEALAELSKESCQTKDQYTDKLQLPTRILSSS